MLSKASKVSHFLPKVRRIVMCTLFYQHSCTLTNMQLCFFLPTYKITYGLKVAGEKRTRRAKADVVADIINAWPEVS